MYRYKHSSSVQFYSIEFIHTVLYDRELSNIRIIQYTQPSEPGIGERARECVLQT